MAVYQGVRQRAVALPRTPRVPRQDAGVGLRTDATGLPRRRRRSAVRARRGPSRLAILLAAIVVAFAGAFFSLSQDIRVSATNYETDRLATEGRLLGDRQTDLQNSLNRLGKAPAIKTLAVQAGLGPLAEPIVVPAR